MTKLRSICRGIGVLAMTLFLGGCKFALLNPQGRIAVAEKDLLIDALLLMLIVVIPVMILTLIIAWRYRAKNTKAEYLPTWCHSNVIEAICWGVPLAIIITLATMTWISTHKLDPYKSIVIKGKKTLTIQVVALNWKWLFIYPKQGIATVNTLTIPTRTPVRFFITADAPMNSIEIPQLAGQIYAMAAMRTQLHLTADHVGTYEGFSTNYSGDGFAGMKFKVHAVKPAQFNRWVGHVRRTAGKRLTLSTYRQLTKDSIRNKPAYYAHVKPGLFERIIDQYIIPADRIKPVGKR